MDDVIDSAPVDETVTTEQLEQPQSVGDAALEAVGLPTEAESALSDLPEGAEAKPDAKVKDTLKMPAKPVDVKDITEEDLQRPDNLSHKGRDRFEKLVGGYKAEKSRADDATGQLTQMRESFQALQDLGFKDEVSAQDLITFSKFRASMNGDGKEAGETLRRQIRAYEMRFGENLQASALEAHDDLAEAVRNERIPYGNALEVAKARNQIALQEQQNQQYQQRQQQQYQSTLAIQSSVGDVEAMEANWRATDPDYSAIQPHLLAEMPAIRQHFPPEMWPRQIELLYNTTKRAMSSQARPAMRQSMPAPLRGNGNAPGIASPKSYGEAALAALGMSAN